MNWSAVTNFRFGDVFTAGGSKQQLTESSPMDWVFQLPNAILLVDAPFGLGQSPQHQGGVH